jgi:hypothetical protein
MTIDGPRAPANDNAMSRYGRQCGGSLEKLREFTPDTNEICGCFVIRQLSTGQFERD